MNSLEFRAWMNSSMYYFGELHVTFMDDESVHIGTNDIKIHDVHYECVRCGVIMQWTGLKDKNGVKIFEGDVIRIDPEGDTRLIIYDTDTASYCADERQSGHDELSPLLWGEMCCVIGNIYENPELINDKK